MNQPFEGAQVLDVTESLGIWCNEGNPAQWLAYRRDGKAHLEPSGSWEEWVALAHAILDREEGLGLQVAVIEGVKTTLPGGLNLIIVPPDGETKGVSPPKLKPGDPIIFDIVTNYLGEILKVVARWPEEGEVSL